MAAGSRGPPEPPYALSPLVRPPLEVHPAMPRSLRTIPRSHRGRAALALGLTGAMALSVVSGVNASSHREAPMIAQDPVADNTDVYAFVSPDAPDTVTLIANWIPVEDPAAGPNYYRFGEDVLYSIHIDNNGDAVADVTYEWRFRNEIVNPDTFLYATGQITTLDDENYNLRQRYDVFVVRDGVRRQILGNAILPPDNVGIATPDYENLAEQAVYPLEGGEGQTFAGQRDDAFFADIGSIFDLGQLRPFLPAYQPATRDAQEPVDFFAGYNVHTTSIQVPISALTQGDEDVIGVWSTASRPKVRVYNQNNGANPVNRGRFVQISRLGNPLVNEVVIPLGLKDTFNSLEPRNDAAALSQPADEQGVTIPLVQRPELADLITALYGIETPEPPRNDLVSIFLTGIEDVNQPANVQPAELLRLNTSIPPTGTDPNAQNRLGLLAGENDGFPNGRRLGDDVVDIALRAVAGGTPFTPEFNESPNNELADGVDGNDNAFLLRFPYQSTPWQGYGENNELRGRTTDGDSTVTEPGARP
jgi:hypothetical protein